MERPAPDEIRRAAKAVFLGIALGSFLLIVGRRRSSPNRPADPEP